MAKSSVMIQITHVLCPVDFSEFSRRAVDHAAAVARWYRAKLTVLHVFPNLPVLALPGWLLAGAPGAALVWHYRSRVEESDPLEDSLPLTTYEEIVAAAREADEDDIGLPSKYRDLDEYDPANRQNDDDADAALDSSDVEPAEVVPHSRYIAPLASDWGQPPRR